MSTLIFSEDMPRIDWSEVRRFENEYGVKGSTTLTLPRAWTPAFALISVTTVGQVNLTNPLTFLLGESLVARIRALALPGTEIIVRSSVVGESIWDRGTYRSITLENTPANFAADLDDAAREVIASAPGRVVSLVIQRFVRPASHGEFGNLQRISKTRDHWEVSTIDPVGSMTRQRLNSQRDQAADPESPLSVRSGLARERLFGAIGAWLNNELMLGKSQRLNCEWVTDNRHFYLVQIDEEDEDLWGVNPYQVRIPPAICPDASSGSFLKLADGATLKAWDKLRVLNELWEPEARHKPTLFFVRLGDLPKKADKKGRAALEADFRQLIGMAGIIVRTSVAAGSEKIPNLPRTEGLSPEEAAKWCLVTADRLSKENDLSGLAFVAHRFVAARASAWARAEPSNPIVEINALWGLPDALQFCPYDIWEVHVPTGVVTDYPDYKSDMLISKPDGSWDYVRVKNELARSNSIGSTEAKDLAVRSVAIAERLGRACHIMWFVSCAEPDGTAFNLPWYWTEAHPAERNHDRAAYRVITVSDHSSLQGFKDWQGSRTRQALALKPTDLNLMRDTQFIVDVGTAAKEANIPIILFGSTLAHAYYQLRKIGCTVVTPSEKEHSRIRHTANLGKLVRDKIPSKIAERKEVEITKKISGNLMKGFLISKMIEETIEVREARGSSQKTEELADVFEVLRAMAKAEGISLESIEKAADQKKRKAGGFEEGLVLLQTGIASTDRVKGRDVERGVGEMLAEQTSDDTIEIPFTFFGFMEFDHPRSLMLEHFGVWLQVALRPDRIQIKLVRGSKQLGLPLDR